MGWSDSLGWLGWTWAPGSVRKGLVKSEVEDPVKRDPSLEDRASQEARSRRRPGHSPALQGGRGPKQLRARSNIFPQRSVPAAWPSSRVLNARSHRDITTSSDALCAAPHLRQGLTIAPGVGSKFQASRRCVSNTKIVP